MKLRVFIREFIVAVLLVLILLIIIFIYGETPRLADYAIGAIALASALLSDNLYVDHYSITNEELTIHYITHFLNPHSVTIPLQDIQQVKLSPGRFAGLLPALLRVTSTKEVQVFRVIGKELYEELDRQEALTTI